MIRLVIHKYKIILLLFILVILFGGTGVLVATHRSVSVITQHQVMLTKALVVPHHELLIDQFPRYYDTLSHVDRRRIKKLIFLAPSHFQPSNLIMKTRVSDFELPNSEKVKINSAVLNTLRRTNLVVGDDEVFLNEHAVFLHLPFIIKYFPESTFTPILFTRNVPKTSLETVIALLQREMANHDTLLIMSGDFSHYLSYSQAQKNDQKTLELITQNRAEEILPLSDDYLDCPGCLYVLMRVLAHEAYLPPEQLFHGNSEQYLNISTGERTTSYFVLRW
jgi:AmmeMemoRadiSam system protein B